ncbi:MAG: DUF58 domain-containing protein [Planctomycetes bacterium]|nr:DUF58 domain-containing protein [Planctomycetota bacterium]
MLCWQLCGIESVSAATLFDAELLASVEALVIRTRRVRSGPIHGEHRANESGSGLEFREHRPYTPGDELARVDWNVYRRTGKLYRRLADVMRDLPVRIHVDLSDSLWHESPARADAARVAAFTIAAIARGHEDEAHVFVCGASNEEPVRVRGQAGLIQLAEVLDQATPRGRTDLAACFEAAASYRRRRGLSVIVSDFFDPRGLTAFATALRESGERLLLLRVHTPRDREGGTPGEVTLVDCESGAELELDLDQAGLDAYRAAYAAFETAFDEMLLELGAAGLVIDASAPLLPQLEALFPAGSLVL